MRLQRTPQGRLAPPSRASGDGPRRGTRGVGGRAYPAEPPARARPSPGCRTPHQEPRLQGGVPEVIPGHHLARSCTCSSVRLFSAVRECGTPDQSRRPSLQQLLEWQSPQEAPPTLSPYCQEEIACQSCQVLGQVGRSPHLRRERVTLVSAGHLEDVRSACIGPGRCVLWP